MAYQDLTFGRDISYQNETGAETAEGAREKETKGDRHRHRHAQAHSHKPFVLPYAMCGTEIAMRCAMFGTEIAVLHAGARRCAKLS
eukprot:2566171-Rhodomonas_salina.1